MANKKKTKKRLSRRMRKTIRITSAVILLLSAIGVALIPQSKKTSAADPARVTVEDTDSSIPVITASDKIYTTGDGMFQFAYVNKGSGGDKVAVIVGYDYERSLDGGQLTIPDSFDAYVKYTHAQGTTAGYAAVGKSENVLYYPIYVDRETGRTDPDTGELIVDENGNPETERVIDSYRPCLYSDFNEWYYDSEKGGAKRDVKDFYYTTNGTDYQPTTDEAYQWIHEATVAYISSQHVVKSADETTWELDPTPNTGIFSQASNIKNLSVGRNLLGIGNYAFYNCASLQGITLADGINTIGNSAFANCVNLKSVDIPANSAITAIGDHAFYNNRSLESFTVPVAVRKIGDSAFENCAAIKDIDMSAGGQNVLLDTLGDDVFKGCTALESLSFPDTFNQDIEAGWLEGDSSLKYVKIPNAIMNVVPSADFGLDDLLAQLPEEFYFEGPDSSNIHTTSRDNSFSFKYLDQEIYEKVIDNNGKLVYQVDNNNELIYFSMEPTVSEVDIPDAIGPYHVTKIGTGSFTDNPNLTKITIPSSITEIEGDAFKGCYNLKDVIYEEPINLSYIGDGAFDTQVVDSSVNLPATPELTFTGVAEKGSAPFDYAMDPSHNINRGSQQTTYIKFYTGWPSNLTIQYNPEDNAAELIDYPHIEELASYTADDYPYITPEMAAAASSAKAAYDSGATLTEDQRNIINSALNIDIPNGVDTIKDGIFSGKDEAGNPITGLSPNTDIKTITTENLKKIDPYAFAGCTDLIGAYINGDTTSIGDFAFQDDEKLADVDITPSLQNLGTAPFASCTSLSDVDFKGSDNFVCSDAAIYEYDANKKRATLVEVLKAKGLTYGSGAMSTAELGEVQNIYPYAFYDCDGVISADLSESGIDQVPESCFEGTDNLFMVNLPESNRSIGANAFKDSNIRYVDIPNGTSVIDNTAFDGDPQTITFYAESDSPARYYADHYPNIIVADKPVTYKVTFYDEDAVTILDTVTVNEGEDATTHVVPSKEGYTFEGWRPEPTNITENTKVYATYKEIVEEETLFTVKFVDYDDTVLMTQTVKYGEDCIVPQSPTRTGYVFAGWRPAITNITQDTITYAQYEKEEESKIDPTPTPDDGNNNDNNGNNGNNNGNNGNNGNSDSNNGDNNNNNNGSNNGGSNSNNGSNSTPAATTLYTLTVVNGSGSGSYAAGAQAIVVANNPATGKKFDKWTIDNDKAKLASASITATVVTMPAANVTVTANYVDDKSSSGSGSGSGSSSSKTTTPSNTTFNVNKTGISNTSVASASVSGSTDNYILKLTDSATAKEEVEEALKEKYGTLDNIKYFAFDLSLYDSTGKTKIENKDGLKVNVTLPIPDDLVQYAGNNKICYVVNGEIKELNPKFTTINKVPCMTFTASHFSPYAIYVDTGNLSASKSYNATPKTGDGIAPKYFLAVALLALSGFLFLKKDKRKVATAK